MNVTPEQVSDWMQRRNEIFCDTLFLIFDTARHNNWTPSTDLVQMHIDICPVCGDDPCPG